MRICLQPWICYCRRSLCIVSLLSTLALLELGQAAAAPAGGGPRVQGEDMWEFRAKLMPAPDEAAYFALAEAGKALLRLVVRSWRACQGTLVIGVTGGSLAQVGLDMSTAHTIRKCGNSMAHRCSFHEASVFRTVVGVAWEEDWEPPDLSCLSCCPPTGQTSKWAFAPLPPLHKPEVRSRLGGIS
mmetsp:Transcript_95873/g.310779  ORF Transcript_95873/g.310779 Transcript_95873/m.310779 type:complete len:185 (+) Transcript_95873:99-653(+)